jgi:anti-sigma regulatory factor (Ser/Thr protein kinase)
VAKNVGCIEIGTILIAAVTPGFHHEAVLYSGPDEYLAGTLPDIRTTLTAGGSVLAAVGDDKRRLLSEALGSDADRVRFIDMESLGRNPACIIPAWREFVRDGAAPLLGIGEPVWPGRSDAELVECRRHESLLNLAFAGGSDWRLLCPYDAGALDAAVLEDARRNHPHVFERGATQASDDFTETATVLAWDGALPEPENTPAMLPFTREDVLLVRAFVTERARHAGFDDGRMADLVLAVHELATNTIRHAGGRGVLRTWLENGTFLVEVADDGHIEDPLAGRERPTDAVGGGRGLWIVNHLCDLVQLRSSGAGSVVRLHMSV